MFKKLSSIPYGNCYVIYTDDGNIKLISYTTVVCEIANGWLYVNGLYSATTRKHISAFMREYLKSNYQLAKHLYNEGMKLNIFTGEIEKVA